MKGHWTCCLNEVYNSSCVNHSGFIHAKCSDPRCNDKICFCNNCGTGCTYVGSKAHWSCCNSENEKSSCTKAV